MLDPFDRGLFSSVIFMHASSGWRVPSSVVSVAGRQSLGSGCASGFFSNQSLGISVDQRYVLRETEGKPLHDGIEVLCPLCQMGNNCQTDYHRFRLALPLLWVEVCYHSWAEGMNALANNQIGPFHLEQMNGLEAGRGA